MKQPGDISDDVLTELYWEIAQALERLASALDELLVQRKGVE